MELGWGQSEVSLLGGIDGQRPARCEPVVEEGGIETADIGHEPLHGFQQKEADKNTVVIGGDLAEETRPGWCVATRLAVVDITLLT